MKNIFCSILGGLGAVILFVLIVWGAMEIDHWSRKHNEEHRQERVAKMSECIELLQGKVSPRDIAELC